MIKEFSDLSADIFVNELLSISSTIIWKNQYLANINEVSGRFREVDLYLSAYNDRITFNSVSQFTYDVLSQFIGNHDLILACMDDKSQIPANLRDMCTAAQIEFYKNNYIEYNNYYRMLFGLPDLDDTDYFYNTVFDDIDSTIPVHELPMQDRLKLEQSGYFSRLLEENPTKKYLYYLGKRNIPPYIARNAERFSILYMEPSNYTNLTVDFRELYNRSRLYIIRVFYSDAYKNTSEYDGFIGMCILFMTIQLMHYKYLDVDITRDFYDLDSLRLIYSSYGVPFYPSIPLKYHKKIVKGINRLISYKGSSRVFFDLFNIFDYGSMNIFTYYLMKIHKIDSNGFPIFRYNEDGSLNLKEMYNIAFTRVPFGEDKYLYITDSANQTLFDELTIPDPYWINDQDLVDSLYKNDYNYIESKYIGVELIFDITKLLFESSYFLKLVHDNRNSTEKISCYYSPMQKYIPLYDMVVYAYALISKRFGYAGNIPSRIDQVARVYGFNFKDDIKVLTDNIKNNKLTSKDEKLMSFLSNLNISNVSDIDRIYDQIMGLKTYIESVMYTIPDVQTFQAYKNLHKVLLTTELISESFELNDGSIAPTYSELLSNINMELYERLHSEVLTVDSELDYTLSTLKDLSDSLEYLELCNSVSLNTIIEYLLKMLDFFKSAKVDLTSFNIIYTMKSKTLNMIKLMTDIYMVYEYTSDEDKLILQDEIELCKILWYMTSILDMVDNIENEDHKVYYHDRFIELIDELNKIIHKIIVDSDGLSFTDILNPPKTQVDIASDLILKSKARLLYNDYWVETIYKQILDKFDMLIDKINTVYESRDNTDTFSINDEILRIIKMTIDSSISFPDYIDPGDHTTFINENLYLLTECIMKAYTLFDNVKYSKLFINDALADNITKHESGSNLSLNDKLVKLSEAVIS